MVFQGMEGFDLEAVHRRPDGLGIPELPAAINSVSPNARVDGRGRGLLHIAAIAGDTHACHSLLSAGADPRSPDCNGRTAADLARSAGHFELAAALDGRLESDDEVVARSPLTTRELIGLVRDDRAIVRAMIAGSRLAARDVKGDTPLHIAAMRGKMQLADQLVQAGADLYATNLAGRTPADVAGSNGHGLLAGLLAAASGEAPSSTAVPPPPAIAVAEGPKHLIEALWEQSAAPPLDEIDADQLGELLFEGTTDANQFHDRLAVDEARADFQRVNSEVRLSSGFMEEEAEWDLGPLRAPVNGEGMSGSAPAQPLGEHVGIATQRRGARRPAPPSLWQSFNIDEDACRAVVARIFEAGYLAFDDLDEILGLCDGHFDPVDLGRNLERTFEIAGIRQGDEHHDHFLDRCSDVTSDDLAEAILAACTRVANLPGTAGHVPGQKELAQLTSRLVEARRMMLKGLVESPRVIDILLYMADRILSGEIAPEVVSALSFDPVRPSSEGDQFRDAVEVLRLRRDEIAAGSGRSLKIAVDAAELLELRLEFLNDVSTAIAEHPELAEISARLDRNLKALEAGSDAILQSFIPLCRRHAAQNATEDEDQEDLFQVGFFGLRRAVIRFRPELGTNFGAFASAWLRQSVGRWRADEGRLIRIPVHRLTLLGEYQRAAEAVEARHLRQATPNEIAAELRCSEGQAVLLARLPLEPVGLEQVEGEASEDSGGDIPETIRLADIVRVMHEEIGQLDIRQADIIRRRFGIGFDEEMTLEEVGLLYGVTRERIRQIEAKGMKILRHPGRMRYLAKVL